MKKKLIIGHKIKLRKKVVDAGISTTFQRKIGISLPGRRVCVVLGICYDKDGKEFITITSLKHYLVEDHKMRFPIIDIPNDSKYFRVLKNRFQTIINEYPERKLTPAQFKDFKRKQARGDCYKVSYQLFSKLWRVKGVRLVHGNVVGQGTIKGLVYGHGWVELNGYVLDFSNGMYRCIPRDVYYAIGKIQKVIRYNKKQVREHAIKYQTYGAWESWIK